MWERMAINVLDRPDLAISHPKTADRLADRALIDGVVEMFTKAHPMAKIVRLCTDGDVPCGPINTIADIFTDPHFAARGTILRVADQTLGEIAIPNIVPRLSRTPGRIASLGPALGDWNQRVEDILADESQLRPVAPCRAGQNDS
jgi:succinyl-CoA:(S)-malate CoA-transferase subunit A/succinyl-CoA:(S)-malate CoA-transferase subunit B